MVTVLVSYLGIFFVQHILETKQEKKALEIYFVQQRQLLRFY